MRYENVTMTLSLAGALCDQAGELSHTAARILSAPTAPTDDELKRAFDLLEEARQRRTMAQHAIVDCLRERGHSWQGVGTILGMTRQAAWKRFGSHANG